MTHYSDSGLLTVHKFQDRAQLGTASAQAVADRLRLLLSRQPQVTMIFAAAPSQQEFLDNLCRQPAIDWSRVTAFHMDEYVGLPADAPQRFGNFLKDRLFGRLPFGAVHYLDGNAADIEAECRRYGKQLSAQSVDIVCMGIGENCHIAFNDPHVADFNDPVLVKVVDLDTACRQQHVNDGCFDKLEAVPTHALTLTVPALMQASWVFCMVPGINKADAVFHTLRSGISEQFPSTILRQHPQAVLFIDRASASKLIPVNVVQD